VIESARSIRRTRHARFGELEEAAVRRASMWSPRSSSAATPAIAANQVDAPVASRPTRSEEQRGPAGRAIGREHLAQRVRSIRSSGVHGTERTFPLGNPAIDAAFAFDAWTCSET
jgi:hypothetical protein